MKKILALIFLSLLFFGCTNNPKPETTGVPANIEGENNSPVNSPGKNTSTLNTVSPAAELSFEVSSNKVFETSLEKTEIELAPECFDDACYISFQYTEKEMWNKPVTVRFLDTNGILEKNAKTYGGIVSFAFVNGPIVRKRCFILSQKQYEQYLAKKSPELYCTNVKKMQEMSGLPFAEEFGLVITNLGGKQVAGKYIGGNIFVVDEFWLSAGRMWVTLNHEQVHMSARGYNLPLWFEEGLASYLAYTINNELLGKPYSPLNMTTWVPGDPAMTSEENSDRYTYSAWLVKVFVRDKGTDKLPTLLEKYKSYSVQESDSLETKNSFLEKALQETLNNPAYSLQQYAYPD